jgi:hypothetical protein
MLPKTLLSMPARPARLPTTPNARRLAALLMHSIIAVLQRIEHALAEPPLPTEWGRVSPMIEFHAEAGAPEGALYMDGELVARLAGVNRL